MSLPTFPEVSFPQVVEALGVVRDKFRGQGDHSTKKLGVAVVTFETFLVQLLPDAPEGPKVFGASATAVAPLPVLTDAAAADRIEAYLARHGHKTPATFAAEAGAGKFPWGELVELLPIIIDVVRRLWPKA